MSNQDLFIVMKQDYGALNVFGWHITGPELTSRDDALAYARAHAIIFPATPLRILKAYVLFKRGSQGKVGELWLDGILDE